MTSAQRRPDVASQLRAFNEWRRETFGRAPTPNEPLPLTPTGCGGDVKPPESHDNVP